MATFWTEMPRNFPGFTKEGHISLPDDIRTGHRPMQFARFIAGAVVVGQPVLITATLQGTIFFTTHGSTARSGTGYHSHIHHNL